MHGCRPGDFAPIVIPIDPQLQPIRLGSNDRSLKPELTMGLGGPRAASRQRGQQVDPDRIISWRCPGLTRARRPELEPRPARARVNTFAPDFRSRDNGAVAKEHRAALSQIEQSILDPSTT